MCIHAHAHVAHVHAHVHVHVHVHVLSCRARSGNPGTDTASVLDGYAPEGRTRYTGSKYTRYRELLHPDGPQEATHPDGGGRNEPRDAHLRMPTLGFGLGLRSGAAL